MGISSPPNHAHRGLWTGSLHKASWTVRQIPLRVILAILLLLSLVAAPHPIAAQTSPEPAQTQRFSPFSHAAIAFKIGIAGPGIDIATPLAQRLNLRAGANLLPISTSLQEQDLNVGVNLHLLSAHAALDYFPFNGRFRISPLLVFANNNRLRATAYVPPGDTIRISGNLFGSSATDPLHVTGRVDFRKISPGLSLGFGNILPRKHGRFTMPVEFGFYYAGKPSLQVGFTGSSCDPEADTVVCQPAAQDSRLQQSTAAAIARRDHYLNDARIFPIFSIGIAYRLW
ncbi:hypothetical protein GCM10011507_04480 [Edaphobacter acidisoli]|uniref:Uncharacterized protein n=1 Tax=Edaphobacter acidisoli TaxID=2040573 RepID=A0A916W0F3_9BACT|nr:hypothetical protein [Edaphobacter acidisoli]GGA56265.1 hypothetical protein GCM10011507_04480 [Edaphobacter acidisoli]